jgi:hypothetical protein
MAVARVCFRRDWDLGNLVQPYPGPGGKIPISSGGGQFAVWSPDSRELFFIGPNGDGKAGRHGNRLSDQR